MLCLYTVACLCVRLSYFFIFYLLFFIFYLIFYLVLHAFHVERGNIKNIKNNLGAEILEEHLVKVVQQYISSASFFLEIELDEQPVIKKPKFEELFTKEVRKLIIKT